MAAVALADEAGSTARGAYAAVALGTRARVAVAQGDSKQAENDAHRALTCLADFQAYLYIPDTIECLAAVAADAGGHRDAARLLGAAAAMRERQGAVRFEVYHAGYDAFASTVRKALGDADFDATWAEGAALSTEESIAYAQRGRGERKRASTGWESLTPAELDVVRLVSEGLGNKDVAARLFVSPRTVQAHLVHVYAKLGVSSRVQLAQQAAQHS